MKTAGCASSPSPGLPIRTLRSNFQEEKKTFLREGRSTSLIGPHQRPAIPTPSSLPPSEQFLFAARLLVATLIGPKDADIPDVLREMLHVRRLPLLGLGGDFLLEGRAAPGTVDANVGIDEERAAKHKQEQTQREDGESRK